MMTPEERARADQAFATVADNLPNFWHRLYDGLRDTGFNEPEAFKLLQTYILSQCPSGIRGDDG